MRVLPPFSDPLDELLIRCRKGDQVAWSRLVASYKNLVYGIPRRFGLNEQDCEDVFLTTFQALLRNIDRIDHSRALAKWLSVTAARESLRVRRIDNRSSRAEDLGLSLDEIVSSEESTAETSAIQAQQAHQVRMALAAMAPKCRNLLDLLYFGDDLPYDEISRRLSMPIGAIGPTRARCLERLRKSLSSEGFDI